MGAKFMEKIKVVAPDRNFFDLSHTKNVSYNMGHLVPVMCQEAVPGDVATCGTEAMTKFAPMIFPVMHRFEVSYHTFYVPYRILWKNWKKFIQQKRNNAGQLPAHPYYVFDDGEIGVGSLAQHLGLPINNNRPIKVNALILAAYAKIYDDYYRPSQFVDPIFPEDGLLDGDNAAYSALFTNLRKRCWEHDYFTSCLPEPQQGAMAEIPMGDVKLKDDWTSGTWTGDDPVFRNEMGVDPAGDLLQNLGQIDTGAGTGALAYDPKGTLVINPMKISDLREAIKIQEWAELSMRAGSRYEEWAFAHFGVDIGDARTQRSEYITGTKTPVMITEVLNTTGTENAAQGSMSGHGIAVANQRRRSYYAREFGVFITMMSLMPKTGYYQGIEKKFTKFDPFDYYTPKFANLTEQPVYQQEIYANTANPDDVFGYLPIYSEYRTAFNQVAGEFATSLDAWHGARKFTTDPALNRQFLECNVDNRWFAVVGDTADKLYSTVYNHFKVSRKIPVFGTPSII